MNIDDEIEGEEDQIINEEYKIWKFNTPILYDTLLIGAMEYPSLTVSWIPEIEINNGIESQRIVLGTHTNDQNYLIIAKVKLPHTNNNISYSPEVISEYSNIRDKFEIEYKINHQGEINKARPMPQQSNIIATKSSTSDIFIYNYLNHPKRPIDLITKPEYKLSEHTKEGFGLCWHPGTTHKGYLLSGSDDNRICLFDINTEKALIETFEEHKSVVEDVDWNKQIDSVFVSCGDDRKMIIWDIRRKNPVYVVEAHVETVNSAQFNPFNEYLILTGSNDKTCALWDLRYLNNKLATFKHHKNDVISAKWNPNIMSLFASYSSDRRINIWDLSAIGKDSDKNSIDGPSELLFTHGGHTSRVSEMSWNPNPNKELLCASVSDDNILQIWEFANSLYYHNSGIEIK